MRSIDYHLYRRVLEIEEEQMRDYDLIIVRVEGSDDVTLKPLSRKGFRFFEELGDLRFTEVGGLLLEKYVQKALKRAFDARICFKVRQS